MLRGEIRLVDLGPVRGSEASKRRPVVIVSNNRAARFGRGVVTVVPVTSTSTGLGQDSKPNAVQVCVIAVERLGAVLGRAPRTS